MKETDTLLSNVNTILQSENFQSHDYFSLVNEMVSRKNLGEEQWQDYIEQVYEKILQEIITNAGKPEAKVKFGTSGWRGILGKDIFCKSVAQVTMAIVEMYRSMEDNKSLLGSLGVENFIEVQQKGCVVGFDNRFGGEILGKTVVSVLDQAGIKVYYAGESTTGALSAAVIQLHAAFSINLTPSHNPLEYGGFKFNAADGGPAAAEVTNFITTAANRIITEDKFPSFLQNLPESIQEMSNTVEKIDSLNLWKQLVIANQGLHGLEYEQIIKRFHDCNDFVVAIDSVHGASRLHVDELFLQADVPTLLHLRGDKDVTFGGVAPEPSSKNLKHVVDVLKNRNEKLKLGAIIDPDGDRIRFTDGTVEISMNQFGAMAYYFLHEVKKKSGMVAKTVATSNLANALAQGFNEKIFEPKVGFKEFKPVIGKALVFFEESDGISIIGHTPEKDAYIGLLLAIDMVLTTGKNLGEYLDEIESIYGSYYPERDGVEVSLQGEELLNTLSILEKYKVGDFVIIGDEKKTIVEVIGIDGRKMIFDDGSWLMIRPSGTEPKVRFYVESRSADGTVKLVDAAKNMLQDIGLL